MVVGRGLVCEVLVLDDMDGKDWFGGGSRRLRIKNLLPEPTTKSIRRVPGAEKLNNRFD